MGEALRITAIGMGLVFTAMALVLAAMVLLVRLRDTKPEAKTAETTTEETPPVDERAAKLRVAMIAAAIARAQSHATPALTLPPASRASSSWWAHHHVRQLFTHHPRRRD